jgi:hypothetical protein
MPLIHVPLINPVEYIFHKSPFVLLPSLSRWLLLIFLFQKMLQTTGRLAPFKLDVIIIGGG